MSGICLDRGISIVILQCCIILLFMLLFFCALAACVSHTLLTGSGISWSDWVWRRHARSILVAALMLIRRLPLCRLVRCRISGMYRLPGDFVIIPVELSPTCSHRIPQPHRFLEWIRDCRQRGIRLCSICGGAFAAPPAVCSTVANAPHTGSELELQQMYPTVQIDWQCSLQKMTESYQRRYCRGIDLALYLVEEMNGEYFAHKVAREMVIIVGGMEIRRHSELPEFPQSHPRRIHVKCRTGWTNTSTRSYHRRPRRYRRNERTEFTRIFKKETPLTVHQYITRLRKEKIEQLTRNSDLSANRSSCTVRTYKRNVRLVGLRIKSDISKEPTNPQ